MLSQYIKEFNRAREIYLRIKVRPDADLTKIRQILKDEDGDIIKIDVAAPAVKGKANQALMEFLAKEFAIGKNGVKLIGGAGDRLKLVKLIK